MTTSSDMETILREHGYSVTRARRLVFTLLANQEALTMNELYGRTKGQIDRVSTYRVVALFEKLGIVRRVSMGWKYRIELSDRFAGHHHHLMCLSCGAVIPINEHELESFIRNLAVNHHFQTIEHQVELQGYCGRCSRLHGSH